MNLLGRLFNAVLGVKMPPALKRLIHLPIRNVSDSELDAKSEKSIDNHARNVQKVMYAMGAYSNINNFIMNHPIFAENKNLLTALQLTGNVISTSSEEEVRTADYFLQS